MPNICLWWDGPHQQDQCPHGTSQMSPKSAPHPHLQPPVPIVRDLACRWGLPGLVFIPWTHHMVKGRRKRMEE